MFFGWRDHGLITMDVGGRGAAGEGMLVDVEVEMVGEDLDVPTAPTSTSSASVFKVIDVKVDVPGLHFTIRKSRHWIFNCIFLQPLLGPTVREVLSIVLAGQIRGLLEKLDAKLAETTEKALQSGRSSPGWSGWWAALMSSASRYKDDQPGDDGDEEDVDVDVEEQLQPPLPVTSTSVTFKGVVHTSHQPATAQEQDTIVAIGLGEQILPDAPLRHADVTEGGHVKKTEDLPPALQQEGRVALDELQHGTDRVVETVGDAVQRAADARERVREELAVAGDRIQSRNRVERRRRGWRSDAFDVNVTSSSS